MRASTHPHDCPAYGQTVLVVEDEPSLAETIAFLLRSDGFDVVVATTGPDSLDAFATRAPDLILLDLMIPGMNGLEVCRTIRRTSRVPIIMVTARAGEAERSVGLAAGADDYLTKPFAIAELRARIRAQLPASHNQADTHPTASRSNLAKASGVTTIQEKPA